MSDDPGLIRAHLERNAERIWERLGAGDLTDAILQIKDRQELLRRLEVTDRVTERDRRVMFMLPAPATRKNEHGGWLSKIFGKHWN